MRKLGKQQRANLTPTLSDAYWGSLQDPPRSRPPTAGRAPWLQVQILQGKLLNCHRFQ